MTQQDKGREAFEAIMVRDISPVYLDKDENGKYIHAMTLRHYGIWQAARDHYESKLTEADAIKNVSKAIFDQELINSGRTFTEWPGGYEKLAEAALRAAGIQFKERA
jgi:hypothetical protein